MAGFAGRLWVAALAAGALLGIAVLGVAPLAGRPGAGPRRPAYAQEGLGVVVSSWAWEVGDADSWSFYTVRVKNLGGRSFAGQVVLRPTDGAGGATHRVPVGLAAGEEKNVAFGLLVTPGRYRAEVLDGSGRPVAAGEAIAAPAGGDQWVGLLTDVPTGRAFLPGGSRPPFRVSERFASARDFPADAALLTGLAAVVIVDFDSAGLERAQVAALEDFVALGGSLVLGGGAAAPRTVLALPESLTPLRPDATRTASVAPLAELASLPAQGSALVATGPIAGGVSILEGTAERVPLIVERPLGGGRIVQLAYDPLVELGRTGPYGAVARDVALARAGIDHSPPPAPSVPAGAAPVDRPSSDSPDRPAAARSLLRAGPGPAGAPPPLAAAALMGYALLVGPAGYLVVRARRRPTFLWSCSVLVALVGGGAAWVAVAVPWRGAVEYREFRVQTVLPGGTSRIEGYGVLRSRRPGVAEMVLPAGGLASSIAPEPAPRRLSGVLGPVGLARPEGEVEAPARAGDHVVGPDGIGLRVDSPRWAERLVTTSSTSRGGRALAGDLRLVEGRVTGRITNVGDVVLGGLTVQGSEGTVRLGAELAPGEFLDISSALGAVEGPTDAPGASPGSLFRDSGIPETDERPGREAYGVGPDLAGIRAKVSGRGTDRALMDGEGSVLDLALAGAGPAPGWVHLVASGPGPAAVEIGGRPIAPAATAVVVAVRLASVDDLGAGLGRPRLICACGPAPDSRVYEIEAPVGVRRPLAVVASLGPSDPAGAVEVHDPASGRWRSLAGDGSPAALAPAESGEGRVRLRTSGAVEGVRLVTG
ncbi:MAG: hypothetical protein ACT4OS_09100 [Acidimicrobiales bacterium]